MRILVQKFGGTSVATKDSRKYVYKKIDDAINNGYSLIVVVSAMGRNGDPYATDTLLNLLKNEYPSVSKRELDVIFSCGENISGTVITSNLQKRGYKSVYLTGAQAGIITDDNYTDAKIIRIENENIISLLRDGYTVVVGGGQGISERGDTTSLGRGGSDTTACALGVSVAAEEIDIFTDVEGIMTADPRIVKDAILLDEISYEDCCNLANMGAKVIHPRAVEVAMTNPEIKLYVKSTFSDHPGTLIGADKEEFRDILNLTGIAGIRNVNYASGTENAEACEISLIGSNFLNYPEFVEELRNKLTERKINVYRLSVHDKYITFVIDNKQYSEAVKLMHSYVVKQLNQLLDYSI
ncbi:aspartate kinase [Sedimentibacter hydroxybenzoicus DSM 7310]|uniref:Aspartokinase n=1 Tax=Sedimentibacter hydroxybenzoicus DSM 7310 TaxID=1123245 RepID=A0A974GXN3_SEDHY|nr:aspartate kinase [Sedimentibacter hydroxybenzoicus]NYB75789.1 aspartate kinase [Sedimentibacter hydroxybenzoicus DSM 7310]